MRKQVASRMSFKSHLNAYAVLGLFWGSLLSVSANAALNGMSVYESFGKERYIAALYLDQPTTDATTALGINTNAVMEYQIVSDKISPRSMSRLWVEAVSINAKPDDLEFYANDLVSLTSLIKGRLIPGDKLRIVNTGTGVSVDINGLPLGTIESRGLFQLLMQTWIGPVPPSTHFKEQILAAGDVSTELKSRYDSLAATPTRLEQITANWLAAPEDPSETETETVAVAATPVPRAQTGSTTPPTAPTQGNSQRLAQTANGNGNNSNSNNVTNSGNNNSNNGNNSGAPAQQAPAETVDTPVSKPPQELAADEQESDDSAPEVTQIAEHSVSSAETIPESEDEDAAQPLAASLSTSPVPLTAAGNLPEEEEEESEEDLAAITAEDILSNKRYYESVRDLIYSNVVFPERGLKLGRESEVSISIQLDNEGNVINSAVTEESKYSFFNKAASRAVENSKPFPAPPLSLLEEGLYNFRIEIRFRISN